jgi:hypothetical protein
VRGRGGWAAWAPPGRVLPRLLDAPLRVIGT